MLVVEVIVLCVHWQLVHVVEDQVLAALRQGRQRPHIEEQALVEKATLRLFRHDKAEGRVAPCSQPLGHILEEAIQLPLSSLAVPPAT